MSEISPIIVSGKFDRMGESLKLLREFAVRAAEQAGLAKSRVEGLRLAMDEYATNIISYGYHDAGLDGDVYAEAKVNDDYLLISLTDTAAPFDPTTRPDPSNLDDPLEIRDIGGLGIMLVRQNVDEWRYERIGNQNCNHFLLRRK